MMSALYIALYILAGLLVGGAVSALKERDGSKEASDMADLAAVVVFWPLPAVALTIHAACKLLCRGAIKIGGWMMGSADGDGGGKG